MPNIPDRKAGQIWAHGTQSIESESHWKLIERHPNGRCWKVEQVPFGNNKITNLNQYGEMQDDAFDNIGYVFIREAKTEIVIPDKFSRLDLIINGV